MNEKNETFVFALGGLGEVGKNTYVIEHNDEIIIIDAGVMFPEDELLGVDYVIADYTYLKQNESKIKALFITHGHEDHIGGIPYLLKDVNIPTIYASKIACELIKNKLEDKQISYNNIKLITEDLIVNFNNFKVEFFRTTHSIPDSYGIAIDTPNGTIVSTGDFKFDLTPLGPMANLQKMAAIGSKGVKLLLSDSTNAMTPGFSKSESKVDEALNEMFLTCEGRIILATFASNIYRVVHIIETCKQHGRKVAVFGRSMANSIEIAKSCGFITDKDIFIDKEDANKLNPKEVCLLCTGSQGEPLAALSRIANGSDQNITLMPEDTVIFSSSPIPGNALSVNRVINKLYLKGAKVYTVSSEEAIHASGHGNQEELKLLLRLIKPEYFMPMHGEYRMLKNHADLAKTCGIAEENIFVLKNGDVLTLSRDGVFKKGTRFTGDIYIDGKRIGDVGTVVIKDRKIMSTDGVLAIILNIDVKNKKLVIEPNVTTRGFVVVNDNKKLLQDITNKIKSISISELEKDKFNLTDLKNRLILEINAYIIEKTGRHPIILPMILEI